MPSTTDGTFLVDGVEIDVAIHLIVTDGICRLCIRSTELGIDENTYGACVLIDDAARQSPNFFCSRLSNLDIEQDHATDRYLGTQGVSVGAGTLLTVGGYDFILSRADHVAITPRPNCIDAYGNQVIDTSPVKNKCCNCKCICRCACLTKRSVAGSYGESACLDEYNQWRFPSGAVVELVSASSYDRTCYLSLDPDEVSATPVNDVLIGGTNVCPRVSANWETLVAANQYYLSHSVFYSFSCAKCGDGCGVEIGSCCGDGRTNFPRVLTADVTTTCPSCPTISISLIWDEMNRYWKGDGIMCGHSFSLNINCPFTSLFFQGSPCVAATPTAIGTPSCSPVLASFSFATGGIGCCGGSSIINPTITVTVYE